MTTTARLAGAATLLALLAPTSTRAQEPQRKVDREGIGALVVPGSGSIEAINQQFEREVQKLERRRVEELGRLALSQPKAQAGPTFDLLFRLAIARDLYADASPFAVKVIESEDPASGVAWLAHLVQIVAEADRGAYDESLRGLAAALRLKGPDQAKAAREAGLSPGTQASIVEAYYRRLIQADQVDVARKAMKLVAEGAEAAAVRDLAARRLGQLELVGKPAPDVAGLDLDGKPFKLADARGEVVLVVFWATWCLPNAQEMPWLDHLHATYRGKGLRVVGINLDSASDGGQELKVVLPAIRRYLLDYNVTWPTLLNGPGDVDFARAYRVTEIPAGVLIGRDGKVSHLDLSGRRLERAVVDALARTP